jgi:hypothetical protein
MSNLNQKIAGLVLQNIEFQNDEAETLVEGVVTATADLTAAGIKFDALAGESQTAQDAVEGLVDLAAEIGVAYPELTAEQADKFKGIIANVYQGETPELDEAGQNVFNSAVNAVLAIKELNTYINQNIVE